MLGRKPTKEETIWLEFIIDLGCICCLNNGIHSPCEVHHIEGSRKPEAHLMTIGLCFMHHRGGIDTEECTSRHPYKKRFEHRYGSEYALLDQVRQIAIENGDYES